MGYLRRNLAQFSSIVVLALIALMLLENFQHINTNLDFLWLTLSFTFVVILIQFNAEKRLIQQAQPNRRISWRIFLGLCYLALILSTSKWTISQEVYRIASSRILAISQANNGTIRQVGASRPPEMCNNCSSTPNYLCTSIEYPSCKMSQPLPEESPPQGSKDRDEVSAWGTLFSWLLAIVALVIAFVTSWVYAIAKETKEQAALINASLELEQNLTSAKNALARVELLVTLSNLLEELDIGERNNERRRLKAIRTFIIISEHLFKEPVDLSAVLHHLQAIVMPFQNAVPANADEPTLDPRYSDFVRREFAPFLEDLHFRLRNTHIVQTTEGRACLDQVAIFWRIFR